MKTSIINWISLHHTMVASKTIHDMNTVIPTRDLARRARLSCRVPAVLALAMGLLAVIPTFAQGPYYWDCNDVTAGFGTTGGTWSAPTLGTLTYGWSLDPNGATTVNGNSVTTSINDTFESFGTSSAGLGTGTVTVSGPVNSGPLVFDSASGTVTLGGTGPITLPAAATITVNNASNLISANLTGAAGSLTYDGSSSSVLYLSGTNTFGSLIINSGSLFANSIALPPGVGVTVNSGSGSGQLVLNTNTGSVFNNSFNISGRGFTETPYGYGADYDGALRLGNGVTLTGTITLNYNGTQNTYIGFLAAAAGFYSETISGQITGTGPVQFYDVYGNTGGLQATNFIVLANTSTATPNNYTGNTYIDNNYTAKAGSGGPDNTILELGANEQIPNGPNAGILTFDGWNPGNHNRSCTFELNGFNETVNGINTPTAGPSDNCIQNTSSGASTLTIGDADTTSTYAGTIRDGGAGKTLGITKIGAGTLTLSGVNTHLGPTIIKAGTLALGASATLPNTVSITVSNGSTFDVSAKASFTLGSSQVLQGSGTVNGSVATPASSPGAIVFPGGAGVPATLTFNNDLNLGSGGSAYFDVNNASYTTGNDQDVVNGALTLSSLTAIHIKAGSTAALSAAGDYVLFVGNGGVSMSTTPTLTFDSPVPSNYANYSLVLSGNNVVLHHNATALPLVGSVTASPSILTNGQSTLITVNVTKGTYPLTSVSLDASALGAGTVPLVSAGAGLYTNTVPVGLSVALGSAFLTATATDSQGNQALGSTYVTVVLPYFYYWDCNDSSLGFGAAGGTWSATTLGTLTYGWSIDPNGTTTVNGNSITTSTNDTSESFGTATSGLAAGTVTVSGTVNSGPLIFDAASGPITLGGSGTITLPATATITGNNGSDTISANLAGAVTSLTYNGVSTNLLTLSGTNTFGPLTINGGSLLADTTALPSGVAVTVNSGAGGQLFLNTPYSAANNNFTIDGEGFAETPYGYGGQHDGALKLANGVALTGTITLVSSSGPTYIGFLATAPGFYSETLSGQITGNGPVQFYDVYGNTGGVPATNIILLANTSAATPNNYTGDTHIDNNYTTTAGYGGPDNTILELGASEQIPNGPNAGVLTFDGWNPANINRSCTFELNGFNETVNGISTPTAGTSDNYIQNTGSGASTLTVGDADTTSTYGGTIRDGGPGATLALTKIGAGTLTLSGVNTHWGPTLIQAGTLALGPSATLPNTASITVSNGATFDVSAMSSFTLGNNQILQGSGTVNGSVATPASPGSVVFPGGAGVVGTLAFNNDLDVSSGGLVYFNVNHASYTSGNDQVTVGGNLTLSSLTAVHIVAGSTAALDTTGDYVLFVGSGATSFVSPPALAFDSPVPSNSAHYSLVLSGNNVVLHYNAIALPVVSSVTASPSVLTPGHSTLITAYVPSGTYPLSSVVLDASALGAGTVQLVSAGSGLYTSTVTVSAGAALGSAGLTVTATDSQGNQGVGNTYVTVVSSLVTSVAPNPVTGSSYPVTLSLTGSGFTGATAVWLTNLTARTSASYAPTVNSDTSLSVTFVPGTAASAWNATVVNGSPGELAPFTVTVPTKVSINTASLNSAGAGNLVLSGTGGAAGNSYAVVSATNLNPPVVWLPVVTNVFGGGGSFSYTNTVNPGTPSLFLRLQQ